MATNGNGTDELTAPQRRAVLALLSEPSIDAAAEKAGVRRETLWKWRRHVPEFRAALAEAQREAFGAATTRIAAACAEAAETLVRNTACGMPNVEVAAARAILDNARQALELEDVQVRLKALEERWAEGEQRDTQP